MKKNKFILIALVFLFSSCSVFKKREVNLDKSSFSNKIESKEKADSSVKKTEKTVITETEQADTTAKTPSYKLNATTPAKLNDLISGLTLMDNNLVRVRAVLDTNTNEVKTEVDVKPQDLALKFNRNKRTETDKSEETNKSAEKQNKESTEAKNKNKNNVTEPKGLAWLWGIVLGVVALVLFFVFKKKSPG